MKNHINKAIATVLLILLGASFSLYASMVDIIWDWEPADSQITSFRYRLNDEPWVVVDPSVLSFTLLNVDDTQSYTFEIQQTYDGINYSESSMMTYEGVPVPVVEEPVIQTISEPVVMTEPLVMSEPVVVSEPVEIIEEEPLELVEEEPVGIVEEEPAAEEMVEELPEGLQKLTPPTEEEQLIEVFDTNPWMAVEVLLGTGGKADNLAFTSMFDPDDVFTNMRTMILPSISFDFIYGNLKTFDNNSSLNLHFGLGYNRYQKASDQSTVLGPDFHVGVEYEYPLSSTWSIGAVGGLSLMFTGEDISSDNTANIFYGPYVEILGRYNINDIFSVTLNAQTRFLFSDVFTPYELTGIVRAGFTYRF
ncbi:MAG: hypothetical protein PQJ47_07800 [Sphaerochaetaceae bacterium]|nr:hypothetical protein [Sphaerochaetaceae bacterium]